MDNLYTYLNSNNTSLPSCNSFVIGNEACDLDSVISSIIYAYYLTLTTKVITLPVTCVVKEDLRLRTEIVYTLKKMTINPDVLLFLDDRGVIALREKDDIMISLVDHNKWSNILRLKSYKILNIIDHHVDESGDVEGIKVIEMVGSCCTLIGEMILESYDLSQIPEEVKFLLHSTILLDTINLDREKGRTTDRDVAMIDTLNCSNKPLVQNIYMELLTAKIDLSSLTPFDLLRKDTKTVFEGGVRCYIASITGADIEMFMKLDPVEGVERFVRENNVDLFIIMLAHHSEKGFERFFLVPVGFDKLKNISGFFEDLVMKVDLVKYPGYEGMKWNIYHHKNVKVSRKVVLPLVKLWLAKSDRSKMEL